MKPRVALAVALIPLPILFFFRPDQYAFYPRCLLHEYFGILCPGCGLTRALSALLHGQLMGAWDLNPLIFPLAAIGLLEGAWALFQNRWIRISIGTRTAGLIVVALVLFAVERNTGLLKFHLPLKWII